MPCGETCRSRTAASAQAKVEQRGANVSGLGLRAAVAVRRGDGVARVDRDDREARVALRVGGAAVVGVVGVPAVLRAVADADRVAARREVRRAAERLQRPALRGLAAQHDDLALAALGRDDQRLDPRFERAAGDTPAGRELQADAERADRVFELRGRRRARRRRLRANRRRGERAERESERDGEVCFHVRTARSAPRSSRSAAIASAAAASAPAKIFSGLSVLIPSHTRTPSPPALIHAATVASATSETVATRTPPSTTGSAAGNSTRSSVWRAVKPSPRAASTSAASTPRSPATTPRSRIICA